MIISEMTDSGVLLKKRKSYAYIDFVFQPIYKPRTEEVFFYEVLSRLMKDSGEIYDNEIFFKDINDDMIKSIALSQLEYVSELLLEHDVLINLTLSSLMDFSFVKLLLSYKYVGFHIEINDFNYDIYNKTLKDNIAFLQSYGVMIILDDYYYDYTMASKSLGVINWDYIKIDKQFLIYNTDHYHALESLIYMLEPFANHGIIIEGVETGFQNHFVKYYDILAQGYYFSRPKLGIEFLT